MAEKHSFKTESKQLLDLMIHSIYTHKEIFLRELISNASDAIDKIYFESLTNTEILSDGEEFGIDISMDKDNRTLTIKDNGIGMTHNELVDNLGTIAKSGSKEFVEKLNEANDTEKIDIIGQFGVGFYSSFMVAKKVVVKTKASNDKGYIFESTGEDSYSIDEIDIIDRGTEIILYLRDEENEGDDFNQYLEEYTIKSLVKKYSDYVRYPIKMDISQEVPKKDDNGEIIEGEYLTEINNETLNSMVPLWRKSKKEITSEEYNDFYQSKFGAWDEPITVIHTKVEGNISYNSLVYIPSTPPADLYSPNFEKGLQLYSKGVFIMDKNKDLVPDYLRFVKGLVDSEDLSLNISREILQQNRQLKVIAKNLEKKIISELKSMLKNDRVKYSEFFKNFGVNIKYGIYDNFGSKKDLLKDLVLFNSTFNNNYTTLNEYIERCSDEQEYIYYATSIKNENISKLPQMELLKDKGYEVLYLTDEIDEFTISSLGEYEGKQFKSISGGDLGLETETEKQELEDKTNQHKDLLEAIKEELKDKVGNVKLSSRLKESPICIVSDNNISLEMEKVMNSMPNANPFPVKAEKVLEINPNHKLFEALQTIHETDADSIGDYADLLYQQALLIEGFQIDDPVDFSNKMCELMIKTSNK